ncbi:hypothetical protein F5884DRAFT_856868 [Xylogone sp. PMI_703]|nr:hypothetical protein F5884DRAFT_856868 [Xylogone sp. PMI_703]
MESFSAILRRNDVLSHNPPPGDIHITARGSDWLWTVCAVDFCSLLVILGLLFLKPRTDRIFHYISVLIVVVNAIDYFTIASDIGSMAIPVEWTRSDSDVAGSTRQVFWIRYVDWAITHPLIILNLLLTAGVYWHTILYSVVLEMVYVLMLYVGTLVPNSYRWGYYTIGMVALALVLESLVIAGIRHASIMGGNIRSLYRILCPYIFHLWLLYPICWGISEGGNVIAPDSEQIFYGILDLLTKPVLAFILLFGHTRIDITELDLRLYDRMDRQRLVDEKNGLHEKNVTPATADPVMGTTNGEQV